MRHCIFCRQIYPVEEVHDDRCPRVRQQPERTPHRRVRLPPGSLGAVWISTAKRSRVRLPTGVTPRLIHTEITGERADAL